MVGTPIRQVTARAYEIPTETPQADGTLSWERTTLVVVDVDAGAAAGLGYTYADAALVGLIDRKLARVLVGRDAFDIAGATQALWRGGRNLGRAITPDLTRSGIGLALKECDAERFRVR